MLFPAFRFISQSLKKLEFGQLRIKWKYMYLLHFFRDHIFDGDKILVKNSTSIEILSIFS